MQVNKIILHHSLTEDSGTVSWGAIRKYHLSNGWRDIGYHYGIELIGDFYEILIGRFENQIGAHTVGQNANALGICFVGNFDLGSPPKEQWDKGVLLVRELLTRYDLRTKCVYGHRDFANKSCPGKYFDVEKFRWEV